MYLWNNILNSKFKFFSNYWTIQAHITVQSSFPNNLGMMNTVVTFKGTKFEAILSSIEVFILRSIDCNSITKVPSLTIWSMLTWNTLIKECRNYKYILLKLFSKNLSMIIGGFDWDKKKDLRAWNIWGNLPTAGYIDNHLVAHWYNKLFVLCTYKNANICTYSIHDMLQTVI